MTNNDLQAHGGGEVYQVRGGDHGGRAPDLRAAVQLGRGPALSRLLQEPPREGHCPVRRVRVASVQPELRHEAGTQGPRVQALL